NFCGSGAMAGLHSGVRLQVLADNRINGSSFFERTHSRFFQNLLVNNDCEICHGVSVTAGACSTGSMPLRSFDADIRGGSAFHPIAPVPNIAIDEHVELPKFLVLLLEYADFFVVAAR